MAPYESASSIAARHREQSDLLAEVTAVLAESGYEPLARLHCRLDEGVVELSGIVPTFFLKQLSQAIVLRIEKIKGVRNLIQVV